ncbi:MAG: transcription termination factor NusA [Thermoanaerobaculales bacterium]|jgi:N utilization substance protein A|nr:transcription termination factor NusA [Thermoanaerobaculales bacterium]
MRLDINTLVGQLAAERDIEPDKLIDAIAEAISSAARKQYKDRGVHTEIDPVTGEVESWRVRMVVEEVEDPEIELTLDEARAIEPEAEIGHIIKLEALDNSALGRIAAQSARQVLFQRVREAERAVVYRNYIERVGEMINGIVKRIDRGAIIIELGDTEGIIPRNHQVRHERYTQGDRIRAVVVDVNMDASRPQIVMSRTDPKLLEKLLEMEVPEIYDGTVIIKLCVREPGERAKVAVFSKDRDVDPVGACVGLKGARVQAITRELKGEKIDIIPWNSDLVTFAQNALAPAKINRVAVREEPMTVVVRDENGDPVLDENGEVMTEEARETVLDVIVGSEQLSLAIGKRGQNVRLASRLLDCRIEIKSEEAVKDELASALASMLREMEGVTEEEALPTVEVPARQVVYDELIPLEELEALTDRLRERLKSHAIHTVQDILARSPEELSSIPGIGPVTARKMLDMARHTLDEALAETADAVGEEE